MPEPKQNNCRNCPVYPSCRDDLTSWIFLFIGLLATIALRAVNLFIGFSPFWTKASWYIGVGGFFVYFLYKYGQDHRLRNEITARMLAQKLGGTGEISAEDRKFLSATLCRLKSSKDTINYFFIFLSSGIALILGIYFDLVK